MFVSALTYIQIYFRLPQDVFQTAKVSKLLLAINNGKAAQYKGKTLDQIEFSDSVESDDSDGEVQSQSSITPDDDCSNSQLQAASSNHGNKTEYYFYVLLIKHFL